MKITTVGIDLAKNVFQVHGVDGRGKAVLRKSLKRAEVVKFFANLEPCLVGMEACGSAHFWARKLIELGHTVRILRSPVGSPKANAVCERVIGSFLRKWVRPEFSGA